SVPAQGAGSTYAWTITGGTLTAGQGTATVTFTSGGVGTLYLTCQATNAAGATSAVGNASINVLAGLATPQVSAPANLLLGSTGNIATVPEQASGVTYNWSVANGAITAGQGTSSIIYTPGTAGGALTAGVSVSNALSGPVTGGADAAVVAAPYADLLAPTAVHPNDNWMQASISPQAGMSYSFT